MKKILLQFILLLSVVQAAYTQDIDSIVNRGANAYLRNGPRIGVSIGVIEKSS